MKSESVLSFYLRRTLPFYLMKFVPVSAKRKCELPSGFTDYIFDWDRMMKNMEERRDKFKKEFPERYKEIEEILEEIKKEVQNEGEFEPYYYESDHEFSEGYSDLCCLSDY